MKRVFLMILILLISFGGPIFSSETIDIAQTMDLVASASDDDSAHESDLIQDHITADQPDEQMGETFEIKKTAEQLLQEVEPPSDNVEKAATALLNKRQQKLREVEDQKAKIALLEGQKKLLTDLIDKFRADLVTTEDDEVHYAETLQKMKKQVVALKKDEPNLFAHVPLPRGQGGDDDDNDDFHVIEPETELSIDEVKRRADGEVGTILEPGVAKKERILTDIRSYLESLRAQITALENKLLQAGAEVADVQTSHEETFRSIDDLEKLLLQIGSTYEGAVIEAALTDIRDRRAEVSEQQRAQLPLLDSREQSSYCLLL